MVFLLFTMEKLDEFRFPNDECRKYSETSEAAPTVQKHLKGQTNHRDHQKSVKYAKKITSNNIEIS